MAAVSKRLLTYEFVLPASPMRVYKAWLSSKEHTEFTGAKSVLGTRVGAKFTAGDKYMWGKNLELKPGRKIVQTWRTTEFPADCPDSRIEIRLFPNPKGTRFVFKQTGIPSGQVSMYKTGWRDYYWKPMLQYFKTKGS